MEILLAIAIIGAVVAVLCLFAVLFGGSPRERMSAENEVLNRLAKKLHELAARSEHVTRKERE